MMEEVDELELLVERVAGLDVGKAEPVACVRVPHPSKPGRRMQEGRAGREEPAGPRQDRHPGLELAKVAERGMCSPSLVHPEPILRLRDLTRYRRALVADRGREMQRAREGPRNERPARCAPSKPNSARRTNRG
jgi:hypothetical protein